MTQYAMPVRSGVLQIKIMVTVTKTNVKLPANLTEGSVETLWFFPMFRAQNILQIPHYFIMVKDVLVSIKVAWCLGTLIGLVPQIGIQMGGRTYAMTSQTRYFQSASHAENIYRSTLTFTMITSVILNIFTFKCVQT